MKAILGASAFLCTQVAGKRALSWPRVRYNWMRWLVNLNRITNLGDEALGYTFLNLVPFQIHVPPLYPSLAFFSLSSSVEKKKQLFCYLTSKSVSIWINLCLHFQVVQKMCEHGITFPYHCPYSIAVASGTVLINYLYQPQLEVKQIPDRSAIAPPRAKNMK